MQRSTNEQALALACVVILNWLIAHLATSWAMPPEVQSAVQSVITIGIGYYLSTRAPKPAPVQADPPAPVATTDSPAAKAA